MSKQPVKAKLAAKAPTPKLTTPTKAPQRAATASKTTPALKTQQAPMATPVEPKIKRGARAKGGEEVVETTPAITTTGDANTNELATVSATAVLSLRDLTVQRYQLRGWQIMNTPRGGINDLVAGKSVGGKYKYHFVQFVDSEDDIDNAPRYKGEAKGAFIQNAYSNQATPVYVIPRRSGINRKVVLENADTTQKIIP